MQISIEPVIIGAFTGLAYAVLAAGLVLVFRATRVINFAYGEIGAFGAAVLAKLVLDVDWNFFAALAVVVVTGAAVGAVIELAIVRRLFEAPRLILLVATIGVSQVMFFAQAVLPGIDNLTRYPSPLGVTLRVGNLLLRSEHFMVIAIVPVTIAALSLFMNRSKYGIAIRAAAENPDAARLAGISVRRVSTTVWVISAALATITAVLVNPLRGVIPGSDFSAALGPGLLLRALTAALIGGLRSFPLALAGGVGVGIVEAVLFYNVGEPGVVDLVLFVAVLVIILVRRQGMGIGDAGSWSLSGKVRPIPERLRQVWWVRRLGWLGGGASVAVAILLSLFFTDTATLFLFTRTVLFAMIALSLTVLTGWAGQLSLGQYAFVGLGSFAVAGFQLRGMPFGIAVFYCAVGGVIAALLIGAPALRVKGLFLAITTLAFAVAARGWLFTRRTFLGDETVASVDRGELLFLDLRASRTYFYVCLAVLVFIVLALTRLRESGIGRTLIAVRDNEAATAAFTVSPAVAKLSAFAVAGGLAALAGGLLAGARVQFAAANFGPEESLRVVSMAIIGGLGSIPGSVLGAVYVIGLPALVQDSAEVRLLTSGVGLLILLLYFPGGLAQILYKARDAILARAERTLERQEPEPSTVAAPVLVDVAANGHVPLEGPALKATDVTVRFGGRIALDSVSIEARDGEIVGLIGSNGAGKSTLVDVIGGFTRPERGDIEVCGTDVTALPAHERARLGLGRVFQDARLFGDLTVREAIALALEARERSELVPSLLGLPPARRAERTKLAEAGEIIAFLGLGRYGDSFIADLSTGTRRIAELGCLVALRPRVILLDEPTAGVAQKETEAFDPLITQIRRELDATLLIIEHDIPLIMSLSNRVYCLAAGQVIAVGKPAAVRRDPKVIAAYLGTDERAIRRSGSAAVVKPERAKPGARA
jgi:ABC-type branched-subunit amino acid transport system ATPase component/ABC-type branched-subunit amino acid transport system permease subunit